MAEILIIDDDPDMRRFIRVTLEQSGHRVTEASNGAEGLTFWHQQTPDLVITDMMMPEKEGLATIMELMRESPETRVMAISGATGKTGEQFLQMAQRFGAIRTLSKPFTPDDLIWAVTDCINRPR